MATLADLLALRAISPQVSGGMTVGSGLAGAGQSLASALLGAQQLRRDRAQESALAEALTGAGVPAGQAQAVVQSGGGGQLLAALLGESREGFTLSPGETRFGPSGEEVASVPPAEPKRTADLALADELGFDLSTRDGRKAFADFKKSMSRAPQTTVNLPGDPSNQIIKGAKGELYRLLTDDQGRVQGVQPLPGTIEAEARGKAAKAETEKERQRVTQAGIVGEDINRALGLADSAWTTGVVGQALRNVGGTEANDLRSLLNTIKANVGFDKLQQMREASPTGGALGQVSERENELLQSVLGSLEQSQSPEQLQYNLKRLYNTTMDVVHGAGEGPTRYDLTSQTPPSAFQLMTREELEAMDPAQMSDEQLKAASERMRGLE